MLNILLDRLPGRAGFPMVIRGHTHLHISHIHLGVERLKHSILSSALQSHRKTKASILPSSNMLICYFSIVHRCNFMATQQLLA